jgi:hypothetical protein
VADHGPRVINVNFSPPSAGRIATIFIGALVTGICAACVSNDRHPVRYRCAGRAGEREQRHGHRDPGSDPSRARTGSVGNVFADRILKTAFVASSLNNAGAVVGVLQVALGVEVIVFALRLLGVVDPGRAA